MDQDAKSLWTRRRFLPTVQDQSADRYLTRPEKAEAPVLAHRGYPEVVSYNESILATVGAAAMGPPAMEDLVSA